MQTKPLLLAVSIAFVVAVFGITLMLATAVETPALGEQPQLQESGLATFDAAAPRCSNAGPSGSGASSQPIRGGTRLNIITTIPIATRDASLESEFEQIGPGRYWLNVERHPGNVTGSCDIEIQFNATVHLVESTRYTVVLTYDGSLIGTYWSDVDGSGSFMSAGTGMASDASTPPDAIGNATATPPPPVTGSPRP